MRKKGSQLNILVCYENQSYGSLKEFTSQKLKVKILYGLQNSLLGGQTMTNEILSKIFLGFIRFDLYGINNCTHLNHNILTIKIF